MGAAGSKPTGNDASKQGNADPKQLGATRGEAITGGTGGRQAAARARPASARHVDEADYTFVIDALGKLLLFSRTDNSLVRKVVMGMWERDCEAGAQCCTTMTLPCCTSVGMAPEFVCPCQHTCLQHATTRNGCLCQRCY
jgi:hypothetical protein